MKRMGRRRKVSTLTAKRVQTMMRGFFRGFFGAAPTVGVGWSSMESPCVPLVDGNFWFHDGADP
jgi:hypothetical protein